MNPGAALHHKLTQGGTAFGTWVSLAHPSIAEMMCKLRVDFLGIDIEHSTISQTDAQRIIATAHAAGQACLPRIASHNFEAAKRLLDSGADGVIVPNVDNREAVDRVASWLRYAPEGIRGFGIARAQGYGHDFAEYVSHWNARAIFVPQIESVRAVESAREIVSHPAVTAVMLGPYDLSGSLGVPGQIQHQKVQEACDEVRRICAEHGVACGTHVVVVTAEAIRQAVALGNRFVVLASDVFVLWKWAESAQQALDAARA